MARVLCVGAGHVGLPLSLQLWDAGHRVALVDVDEGKIASLRGGRMPFFERGCDALLERAFGSDRFEPLLYADDGFPKAVEGAEYIIMTLGTPLGTDYTFRFDQYFDVLRCMTPLLTRGVTLIVRSTVAPHFTRNVVTARIASERDWIPGVDFFPSFCPERLLQGRALADIHDLPEIIGADDEVTADRVERLFLSLNPNKRCSRVSTVEAELAKLYLNTLRYTLFGLANEFAQVAEQYGADMFSILDAANDGYPRGGIPHPGPSRGPCLGKDTATLAFSTSASLIAHAAIKANENVVLYAAEQLRAALGSFVGRRVVVFGMAFKADSDDCRDNLTSPLINLLEREGAATAVFDPVVPGYDDSSTVRGSDAVALMTPHSVFRDIDENELSAMCDRPRASVFVLDLWNIWPWADRIFGKGCDDFHASTGNGRLRLADARGSASPGRGGSRGPRR